MSSNKTTSILFSLLLIVAFAGNGIAQNVDQSALALKKGGEVLRKHAGFETKDERVEVGSWLTILIQLELLQRVFWQYCLPMTKVY